MPITAVRTTNIKAGFDFDSDSVADPGDVLQHSLIITNTEVTALNGLTIEETLTGITTVPGSVMIGPIALDDTFNMVGNTSITITRAQLIGNDIDPDGAEANMVVTIDLASDINGTIIDNGNNTYTFTPNVGFEGNASFEYSLTDEQGVTSVPVATIDGLVTIAVEDMVWFIDNTSGGSGGSGTQADPFKTIANFNAVNDGVGLHPATADIIYLREGTGTYTTADGINLLNNQVLVGQGENLVVNNSVLGNVTVETGTSADTPTIVVTGAGNQGIQLAQGNTIKGLDVGMSDATAVGISDGGGTVGNLVISNVAVGTATANTGSAVDIDQGGTLNVQLDAVRSTGAARAIDLGTTTGLAGTGNNFTVSGTTQIDDVTGDGIAISNSSLNATFTGKVTILNDVAASTGDGVDLQTNTGTYNFNGGVDINVNGTGAFGFRGQSSGTINIVDPASNTNQIVSNNGTALFINPTQLNAALDLVQSGGGANGISLTGMTGSLVIDRAVISGYTGVGLQITNTDGSVTINDGGAGSTIGTGTTGDAVNISGGTGPVIIGADITKTTAGNVVDISGHNSTGAGLGTVMFNGAISATGGVANGITLTNNTGGVDINFTGGVTLNTGANTAFNFTNIQATGADVTLSNGNLNIDTTSGTGINATSTTVGAGTLTIGGAAQNNVIDTTAGGRGVIIDGVTSNVQLLHVNVAGGSGTAIFVKDNGATGSFQVTGSASDATSGGTIALTAGGADGATDAGIGIYLQNANNISLSNLDFNGTFNNFGIRGLNVNNFTLRDSEMDAGVARFGTLASAGNPEGAIIFGTPSSAGSTGLRGTGLIEGNVIGNSSFDNLDVYNYGANSLNLTIRDSANDQAVFNDMLSGGNDSVFVETGGTHNLTLTVGGAGQGVAFTGVYGDHIQTNAVTGTPVQNIAITNNTFSQSVPDGPFVAGGGVRIGGGSQIAGTNITVNYNFSNNVMTGSFDSALDGRFNGLAGTITGVIANNTIGTDNGTYNPTVGLRGAGTATSAEVGMFLGIERANNASNGNFTYAMRLQSNNIADTGDYSVYLISQNSGGAGPAPVVEATFFNNTFSEYSPIGFSSVRLLAGGGSAGDDGRMGVTMSGNTFDVSGLVAVPGIFFDQPSTIATSPTHFYVPGLGGTFSGGAADTALTNFLDPPANTFVGTADLVEATSVEGVSGETLTLPVPILAATPAGEDWETAFRDWLANLQVAPPVPADTGTGGGGTGGGGGGSGDGGDPGAGGPPLPPEPPHPVIVDDGVLSQAELDYFVAAAIQHWTDAGASAAQIAEMRATAVSVADMTGSYLGTSDAVSIRIDSNGAGYGWFLDRTPDDNAEYQGSGTRLTADSGPAAGKMDLLTVLMHEFGHQVGLDDLYGQGDSDELMYGYANLGERRLPQGDDLANAGPGDMLHESFLLAPVAVGTLPAGKAVRILWESTVDTFSNQLIPNPFGFFSTISGSNFVTFNSNTENLTIDSLTLSGTIWNDNGAGGGVAANGTKDGAEAGVVGVTVSLFVDANNNNVADTPGTPLVTGVLTNGSGDYTFTNLAPGNYIVRVDQDNFDSRRQQSLFTPGLLNSPVTSPEPFDPDNNVNNDDNGARVLGQPAWSDAITLNYNSETVADGTGKFDINDTLDFGFFANAAPVLADLAGDTSTFTEDGAPVILDDSSAPELAASVTDANQPQLNGGTLTVAITANEDAADDVLGISTAGTVTLSSGTSVGSIVSVGGLAIGTVTADGNGGDDLVVSLNTNDATLANVTTLVRSLTYANIDTANPSTLPRTVAVTLNDGLGGSDSENVFVNVTAVNDPPTGADNTITIDEDDFGDIDAADFGFNDVDGDSLSAVTITGVTGGTLYYDSGNDGFDPGDAVSTFPITVTAADLAGNLVAFRAGPNVNGAGIGTITFQVIDDSGAGNDTDTSANTLTVDVAPINDQPDVPATLADVNATEGVLAAVSGITVSDVDLDALNSGAGDYDGAIFGIGQAVPDASDSFAIDTTGASFTISGNQLQVGGLEFATFTVGGGALGIAFNSNDTVATTTLVNEVLSRIQYVTNADDPPATLTLTYLLVDGAPGAGQGTVVGGNDIDAGTVDVNITPVNDEPTLTATAVDPTFTEGDAARDLFSAVTASTVEAGQTITSMSVTVTNVTDGVNELVVFDGSDVALTNGNSVVTATNTLTVNVSVTGTTATLTFTGASLSPAETTTLIDGLAYRNDSEDPTDADRVVTVTQLVDSGSNISPDDNTSALSVASTVDVVPVDDNSTAGDDSNDVDEDGTIVGASVFGNDSDPDDPLVVVEVNGVAADVGTQITLTSGALLTLNDDGTYDYDPNGAFDYLITVAKATSTGAVNTTFADTFTYELEDGTGPATVTITVHGKDSAGDELWGNGTDNSINDQFDDDVFRLGQGGDDTVNGFGGNDAFAFGAAFTDLDVVDGGAGFDTIVLAGDYFTTPLVLSPTGVTNVERILVLSDPLLAGFSYDITTDDTNVAAGEVLIVDASGLSSTEELLFDGSAETDGRFLLIGGGCDDELRGGAGDDVLIGGADFNTLDGNGGIDRVDYSLVTGPVDVDLGSGVANDNGLGGADALEEIENATGSAFADVLVGSNVANVLDGGMGADQMTGGDGDDTYVVDNVGDTVSETSAAGGIDTVKSSIGYTLGTNLETLFLTGTATINGTGNGLDNNLTGNSAANILNGGIGADRMKGDGGNDTYIVDNVGDVVIENFLTEGVDTVKSSVSFTLNYFVDNLVLTGAAAINGTGNGLVNNLTGNNAANTLNGGVGADQMKGDGGDDIYVVDNVGDVVIENSSTDGTDTVRSSVTFSLAGQQLEHLVLTGSAAINGTGNALANNLTGNSAANVLNGGGGADRMKGDAGNDTYVVDNVGDVVIENFLADGTDTVQSNISYTLGSFVENLTLTGAGANSGTGNGLGNVIIGNNAANLLKGMAGADTLSGAGGADTLEGGIGDDNLLGGGGHDVMTGGTGQDGFRFDTALSATNNVDDILDFSVADDTIYLDDAIFAGLATGPLAAGAFRAGSAALDGDDRILYDAATGHISYDSDGVGGTAAILFATVTPGLALTNADFIVY